MNKLFPLFLVFSLLFSGTACKKKTIPVASATPAAEPGVAVNVLNTEFSTFSAKGKMQLETPEEKLGSSVTIRIKKDSVIWISMVPGLGIEAIRARITPDTIQILNRLQRQYIAGNFATLQKQYNIAASFELLQAMLLGNYLAGQAGMVKEIKGGEHQQLQQTRNNLVINQFVDTQLRKLKRIQITDQKTGDNMIATYNEFETQGSSVLASAMLILLERSSNTNPKSKNAAVSIKYNKFSLNEANLEFPFSVPADYQRK